MNTDANINKETNTEALQAEDPIIPRYEITHDNPIAQTSRIGFHSRGLYQRLIKLNAYNRDVSINLYPHKIRPHHLRLQVADEQVTEGTL